MTETERVPMGERMATAESWIVGHEKICGDRYRLLLSVIGVGGTIIIGVAGWGLNQVHEDQKAQFQMLQGISNQVAQSHPVTVQMNQPR